MYWVKNFGSLSSEWQHKKKISISYDSIQYDPLSDIKVLVQIEPPSIQTTTQLILENHKKFDLILGWNEDILHLPNAKKFLFGSCWVEWDTFDSFKQNNISFITSNKNWSPGHKLRNIIYDRLDGVQNINGFEVIKHKSPPRTHNKNFLFNTSKYSIVVENEKLNNWFTEKIIDCFATKTIPIYWGCPNIGDYFDLNGIIMFDTLSDLDDILNNLSDSFYDEKINILEKNFDESKKYWNFLIRVENTIKNFIQNKLI